MHETARWIGNLNDFAREMLHELRVLGERLSGDEQARERLESVIASLEEAARGLAGLHEHVTPQAPVQAPEAQG